MNVLDFSEFTQLFEAVSTKELPNLKNHSVTLTQIDSPSKNDSSDEGDTSTLVKSKPKLKRPPLYKVILLNDDFTPMEFVILVLIKFFAKTPAQAEKIMLDVHQQGSGIAGVYPFEVAETKVFGVNEFSRRQKHPLKCIMEEESSIEED